jgi:hypothetical protein
MLKPTVGIELEALSAGRFYARSQVFNILDGELSAL